MRISRLASITNLLACLVCGCLLSINIHATELRPYQTGDWKILLNSNINKPLVVHFWGFTCAPCLEELPRWGDFVAEFPDLKIVFIQLDDVPPELSIQTLSDARLERADNRTSASVFDEYMRFEIDPRWRGELPLTLLVSPSGDIKRLRGTVDFNVIKQWLEKF